MRIELPKQQNERGKMNHTAQIYRAASDDTQALAKLAIQMWDENTVEDLQEEFLNILKSSEAAIFLLKIDGAPAGFAQCQLRHDYVEGTDSSPVGYLEGIFVEEKYRFMGYAGRLLKECEGWAKEQGCTEFASDCELDNTESLAFHKKVGFSEANRIICFTKQL